MTAGEAAGSFDVEKTDSDEIRVTIDFRCTNALGKPLDRVVMEAVPDTVTLNFQRQLMTMPHAPQFVDALQLVGEGLRISIDYVQHNYNDLHWPPGLVEQ